MNQNPTRDIYGRTKPIPVGADQLETASPELLRVLRQAGDQWGPLGVAQVAVALVGDSYELKQTTAIDWLDNRSWLCRACGATGLFCHTASEHQCAKPTWTDFGEDEPGPRDATDHDWLRFGVGIGRKVVDQHGRQRCPSCDALERTPPDGQQNVCTDRWHSGRLWRWGRGGRR